MSKWWADAVVNDVSDAQKLVLKLKEDNLSSDLSKALAQQASKLEAEFLQLQRYATTRSPVNNDDVAAAIGRAQASSEHVQLCDASISLGRWQTQPSHFAKFVGLLVTIKVFGGALCLSPAHEHRDPCTSYHIGTMMSICVAKAWVCPSPTQLETLV
jgi:hypothetical protein